ncbi:MAG TPA: PASTA domain-containing protein, partial [Candidatus Hydrogenedentes bacterium]|nr:PASTA domain-containing protein [Candidatus Hydrogenedentota bacterium]
MSSSVVSLKRGLHAAVLLSLVCLAMPALADTVDTPVRQYGYSYGFPMSGIAALSPDGSQFAMASGATVRIVDTDTGLPVRTLSGHLQTVTAVAWSADGTRIASGSLDYTARVWDAATGEHICTTSQPRGEVLSVALSGNGSRLITGTASLSVGGVVVLSGAAYLWDGTTGVLINGLGHAGNVSAVAFSPDGAYAATGSSVMFPDDERVYGAAYLWNLGTMSGTLITRNPVVDPPPAPVPDVVGLQQAAAETAITGASLSVGTVTGSWSATVPVGEVMSQSPPAVVAWVLPGTRVDMEVSMGPEPVMVPIAVGRQRSVVETVLTGAGLAVGTVTESYSATVPVGYVMSQNPAAGASVPAGSAVALTVSKGPELVTVPNVVGMTQAEATTALLAAPLTLGTVTEAFSATVAA